MSDGGVSVQIEAQGHLFKLRAAGAPAVGGGKRGRVVGFSAASRKRLLERLARLRGGRGALPLFVTLTYPDIVDCEQARRNLRAWFRRVKRRYPGFGAVWRLELQERGAPHFHLLVYGVRFLPVGWIRSTWCEVIGYRGGQTVQINVKHPRSWRGVLAYVAKYLGKPQSGFQMAELLADGGAGAEAPALLDYGTYLSAMFGRVWGLVWSECMPFAVLHSLTLPHGDWLWRLKRCARRVWAAAGRSEAGFTLFREDPGAWLRLAEYFQS